MVWNSARWIVAGIWAGASLIILARVVMRTPVSGLLRSPGPVAVVLGCVCLLVAGLSGRSRARESRLKAGASISIPSRLGGDYTLTHMGVSRFQMAERVTAAATIDATRNDKPLGLLTSERRQYFGLLGQPIGPPVTSVGIHRGMIEDIRVIFLQATANEEALYQIRVVPFVSLAWLGFVLLLLGGLLIVLGPGE